jgi:copper chaperone
MSQITFSVPEIHCDHCKHSIEGALRPLSGVARADVDVASKLVSVDFGDPATIASMTAAIEEQGYDVAGTV